MRQAVILANGDPPSASILLRALAHAEIFLCADGGANTARKLGVRPSAIVGDFDSVTAETLDHFQGVAQVRDSDQETTDTEKAIRHALANGPLDEITLLGASSGRIDHVLGHLGLLRRYLDRVRLVLEDDAERAWLSQADVQLTAPPGTVISFFAIDAPVEGVTTENLQYPLRNATLELGGQDSISNVIERTPAWVRFARGRLLVVERRAP